MSGVYPGGGFILRWIEAALNQSLSLDFGVRRELLKLLRDPVIFRLQPRGGQLQLEAVADQIRLSIDPAAHGQLTLYGTPLALAAWLLGDRELVAQGRIRVEGDSERSQQLQDCIGRLDPDWEAVLAKRIGDVPAHVLGRRIREAIHWSRRANQSLFANIDEYLHEETRVLPPRTELEAQGQDIEKLRQALNDLEARTESLESKLNPAPEE